MTKSAEAFRTISEVADWLGVQAHVLRFWKSKFSQVKPVKRAGGRRYYRPSDMQLLGGIRKLLHDDGLTIKGVQKMLREQGVARIAALSKPLDSEVAQLIEAEAEEIEAEVVQFRRRRSAAAPVPDPAPSPMEVDDPEDIEAEPLTGGAEPAEIERVPVEQAEMPFRSRAASPEPEETGERIEAELGEVPPPDPEFDLGDASPAGVPAEPDHHPEASGDVPPPQMAPEDEAPVDETPSEEAPPAPSAPASATPPESRPRQPNLPSFLSRPPAGRGEPPVSAPAAPEPQRPRASVVDAPDPPEESQIDVPPGVLARLAGRTRLDPGSAGAIAPLAAELRSWLDTARGGRA